MSLVGVLALVGFFFWIRGMLVPCKADLAAGTLIFLLSCGAVLVCVPTTPVGGIGGLMLLLGVTTAVVVATNPDAMSPTAKHDFRVLATGLIIIGFLLGLVM